MQIAWAPHDETGYMAGGSRKPHFTSALQEASIEFASVQQKTV